MSCKNALDKIGTSQLPKRYYARRPSLAPDIPLMSTVPIRYLSDDGICAIDLRLQGGTTDDISSEMYVTDAAKEVIVACVRGKAEGGRREVISLNHRMWIQVSAYEPQVDCEPQPVTAPSYDSCAQALQKLPAAFANLKFARGSSSQVSSGCQLPRKWTAPPDPSRTTCQVTVDTKPGTLNKESWWRIYHGGIAINEMCVQHGFTGTAINLGDKDDINITLGVFHGVD